MFLGLYAPTNEGAFQKAVCMERLYGLKILKMLTTQDWTELQFLVEQTFSK